MYPDNCRAIYQKGGQKIEKKIKARDGKDLMLDFVALRDGKKVEGGEGASLIMTNMACHAET